MDFEIFTYGNGDFIRMVMNAVASIFGSENYMSAMRIAAMLGFLGVLVKASFDRNVLDSFKWFLGMLIFCWVLLVPKSNVIITDRVLPQDSSVVANVPIGLAATAGLFSQLSDVLTRMSETVFSLPNGMTYQGNGLLFAHKIYEATSEMQFSDERTAANYSEFIATCVIFDGVGQGRFTWEDVVASDNLVEFFSTRVARYAARFKYIDANGSHSILPCRDGFVDNLLPDINSEQSVSEMIQKAVTNLVPSSGSPEDAVNRFRDNATNALNFLIGVPDSVENNVIQAAMINALPQGLSRIAQETGADAFNDYIVSGAQTQQMLKHTAMGEIIQDKLPLMHGVFEAFLYAIFPVIVLLGIVSPTKAGLNYVKMLVWINLWPPLFAILNFAITYWDQAALTSAAMGAITAGNLGALTMHAQDSANATMYIGMSLPVIAWALVAGAGGMVAGIASGYMKGYESQAEKGASEVMAGRMERGGSLAQMTSSGHMQMTSLADSGTKNTTTGDGTSVMDQSGAMSKLAVNAERLESIARSNGVRTENAIAHASQEASRRGSANAEVLQDLSGVNSAIANGKEVSDSAKEALRTQQSENFTQMKSAMRDWAEKNGQQYDDRASASLIANWEVGGAAGKLLEFVFGGEAIVSGQATTGMTDTEAFEFMKKFTQSDQFSSTLQSMVDGTKEIAAAETSSDVTTAMDSLNASNEDRESVERSYSQSLENVSRAIRAGEATEEIKDAFSVDNGQRLFKAALAQGYEVDSFDRLVITAATATGQQAEKAMDEIHSIMSAAGYDSVKGPSDKEYDTEEARIWAEALLAIQANQKKGEQSVDAAGSGNAVVVGAGREVAGAKTSQEVDEEYTDTRGQAAASLAGVPKQPPVDVAGSGGAYVRNAGQDTVSRVEEENTEMDDKFRKQVEYQFRNFGN